MGRGSRGCFSLEILPRRTVDRRGSFSKKARCPGKRCFGDRSRSHPMRSRSRRSYCDWPSSTITSNGGVTTSRKLICRWFLAMGLLETTNASAIPKPRSLRTVSARSTALGSVPVSPLLRVLEEVCKVKVFHMAFEPSGSAACALSDRYGAAILLNSKNVRWRRNFDLAHELFHLLTWNVFRRRDTPSAVEASPHEEKLATCFARNLLMPQEPLRIAVDSQRDKRTKLTFDGLFEVARQFDVSIEALLWQMTFVFNLPKEDAEQTIEKLRDRMSFWDRRQQDAPPSRPLRFEALANEALRKGLISTGRYAEYLGITRRQAMRQVEQEAPDDAEIEVART